MADDSKSSGFGRIAGIGGVVGTVLALVVQCNRAGFDDAARWVWRGGGKAATGFSDDAARWGDDALRWSDEASNAARSGGGTATVGPLHKVATNIRASRLLDDSERLGTRIRDLASRLPWHASGRLVQLRHAWEENHEDIEQAHRNLRRDDLSRSSHSAWENKLDEAEREQARIERRIEQLEAEYG